MERVYLLIMHIWNGTILMKSEYSVYDTKELVEQVIDKLKRENTEDTFRVSYEIREVIKYNKI